MFNVDLTILRISFGAMEICKVHIALPVLNESRNLPKFFDSLAKQQLQDYRVVVCVNQYDAWWDRPDKRAICEDNAKSLRFIQNLHDERVTLLDKSSRGKGWLLKKGGVGHARKAAMDAIAQTASKDAIIVSMDADTYYPESYLSSLLAFFKEHPKWYGVAIPYYHPLPEEASAARLILRYELYMRYYALNMYRIGNPYRFTALGSAMAFPVWAYQKVGGLTPVQSGEDFYFLQKLTKAGTIGYSVSTVAYPSARFSDRVYFGTGPALIKGAAGDWSSYPFYPAHFFDEIAVTFSRFKALFATTIPVPMDNFLQQRFGKDDIWAPLRKNYRDVAHFEKACINKVDGLRILQYLRFRKTEEPFQNEESLKDFLYRFYDKELTDELRQLLSALDFDKTPVDDLNSIRDLLFRLNASCS